MTPHPLGRLVEHDERSRFYQAPRADIHRSVLWGHHAPVLNQGQLGSCFPPGTLVRMADGGELPIEDVRLGEYVATAEGNTGRVVRTLLRDETEGVLRLLVWGHSQLRMTAEHPVLTARGYVPARELVRGDEIALPRYRPEGVTLAIDTAEYVTQPSHRLPSNRRWTGVVGRKGLSVRAAALPDKIELDHAFGRFIGLFLAEGSCDTGKATFTFADDEIDTLAAEVASTARRFGVEPHVRPIPAHHACKVVIHSTGWSRLLSALCGDGAGMKQMHQSLAGGSDEFTNGVLAGWLDGDGCYRKDGSREGVSISRRLAMNMYDIGQALGMHPVICRGAPTQNRHAAVRQPRWTVSFAPGTGRCRQDDKYVWRKLRHMERESYCGPVYDLTVEGDHSYIAEGVGVHNCTGNAAAQLINTDYFQASRTHGYLNEQDAVQLYEYATRLDGIRGNTYPPRDDGSSGLGAAKAGVKLGYFTGYKHAFGFDHFAAALQLQPVIVGTEWTEDMFTPDKRGYVQPHGNVAGGHEYLALGIDWDAGRLTFLNSWGAWGPLGGRFFMAFDDFTVLLSHQGDVTAPLPKAA